MDKKLKPRFKVAAIVFVFLIVSCPSFFSFANNNEESNRSTNLNLFVKEFIANHAPQIGESGQLIFAINTDSSSFQVTIHTLEKKNGHWHVAFPAFGGSIGEKGFAPIDEKREGDGKTPSGIFPLGIAFGYDSWIATKMPYRQSTDDDFWVDDVNSEDYNKWVKGEPNAASREKMKREDDQYKYGVVIEYNTHPIVKGNGSAIFLHVWKPGESTSGCVAMSEEMVLKILGWLDPARKPLVIMGTESELAATIPASGARGEARAEASARFGKVPDIVDIKQVSPHIIVDMKYATEDNFTKKRLYDSNTCFLRKPTAIKLDAVQKELETMNLGVKVWDCYRPLAVQQTLWTILPDERYVADPKTGSRHNRASSVDVTLVDAQGKELQMPTGFDDFGPRAHHHYQDLPDQAIRNRELLKGLMEKAGFIPLPEEWWHYDDEKWVRYNIMDVSFEDLLKHPRLNP
jgi:D-alanyl-D-alanine dipeptidase